MSKIQTWENDVQLKLKVQQLQQGNSVRNCSWINQKLTRKGKLVVVNDNKLRRELLKYFHDNVMGGGGLSGINATYMKLSTVLYWKHMWKHVREYM